MFRAVPGFSPISFDDRAVNRQLILCGLVTNDVVVLVP